MSVAFDHDVFLTCADQDRDAAQEVVQRLREAIPELRLYCPALDLAPGDLRDEVPKAVLSRSQVFVPFVSGHSASAHEILEQIQIAIPSIKSDARRRVVPVYLDETPPPYGLLRIVGLRAERRHGLADVASKLARAVAELQGRASLRAHGAMERHDERLRSLYEERRVRCESGLPTQELDERIGRVKGEIRRGGVLQAGDVLGGRYSLLELIGHGGFAEVFKAWDEERQRVVAVKVMHGRVAKDQTHRERFTRGIRKMQELVENDVAGIVRVLDGVAEDDGFHYCVLEYLAGLDLDRAIVEGRVPSSEIIDLVLEIGRALHKAHGHGLVHRDVKPTNILLDHAGLPKLTDFDLVWAADTSGGTQAGRSVGTFFFASPEALEHGDQVDCRTDIYSLAMVAVYGLHGKKLPLMALRDIHQFLQRLERRSAVRRVLARALDWDREHRHATVEEFCEELGRARTQKGELSTAGELDSERVRRNVRFTLFNEKLEPVMIRQRYRLERRLGRGASSHVHLAYDTRLRREVALKLFSVERGTAVPNDVRKRLLSEAEYLARLSHPNVVQIFDVDVDDDPIFIAMELIHGTTVAEWIDRARPPWTEVMEVFEAAGQGLVAAHTRKIVHRDFKASNVLIQLDPWRVCVTDFGLARLHEEAHVHEHPGGWSGTPGYMAPEQEANITLPASDQFSFCASLFKALYGELPFSVQSAAAIAESPPPTPAHVGDVPEWILAVLRRGLSPRPGARFASMEALLRALRKPPAARRTRKRVR